MPYLVLVFLLVVCYVIGRLLVVVVVAAVAAVVVAGMKKSLPVRKGLVGCASQDQCYQQMHQVTVSCQSDYH